MTGYKIDNTLTPYSSAVSKNYIGLTNYISKINCKTLCTDLPKILLAKRYYKGMSMLSSKFSGTDGRFYF